MSTNAAIARRAGDGWEGVYHHMDGAPHGLGCYLFRWVRYTWRGDVHAFLRYTLAHDGGWSHIYRGPYLCRPGTYAPFEARQCYCHGYFALRDGVRQGQRRGWQTSEAHDPWLQWAYVFHPERRLMAVLRHRHACPGPCMEVAAVVDLTAPEPDWWEMEGERPQARRSELVEGTWVDRHYPPATRPLEGGDAG